MRRAGLQDQRDDGRELVGLAARGVRTDEVDLGLELFREQLNAESEYLALVLEVEIEDCPGDAAALGYLLERGVLIALVDEDIEGLLQYFAFPLIVLDRD